MQSRYDLWQNSMRNYVDNTKIFLSDENVNASQIRFSFLTNSPYTIFTEILFEPLQTKESKGTSNGHRRSILSAEISVRRDS